MSLWKIIIIKRNDDITYTALLLYEKRSSPYLSNPFGTVVLLTVPRIHCDLYRLERAAQMTNALSISLELHKHLKFDSY